MPATAKEGSPLCHQSFPAEGDGYATCRAVSYPNADSSLHTLVRMVAVSYARGTARECCRVGLWLPLKSHAPVCERRRVTAITVGKLPSALKRGAGAVVQQRPELTGLRQKKEFLTGFTGCVTCQW